MWFCSGQARAEFALFARFGPACGTTNRQRFLPGDFHVYTMHACSLTEWSIVTIAQSSAGRMISLEKGQGERCELSRQCFGMTAATLSTLFSGATTCPTNRPQTQTNPPNRRLTRSAPQSHRCLSLSMSPMPRDHCMTLHISLTPRRRRCLIPLMSLTRAFSRWQRSGDPGALAMSRSTFQFNGCLP